MDLTYLTYIPKKTLVMVKRYKERANDPILWLIERSVLIIKSFLLYVLSVYEEVDLTRYIIKKDGWFYPEGNQIGKITVILMPMIRWAGKNMLGDSVCRKLYSRNSKNRYSWLWDFLHGPCQEHTGRDTDHHQSYSISHQR